MFRRLPLKGGIQFCNQHLHKQQPGSDLFRNTVILIY